MTPVGMAPLFPVNVRLAAAAAIDHRAPTHDPSTCPICNRERQVRQSSADSSRASTATSHEDVAPRSRAPLPAASEILWTGAGRASVAEGPRAGAASPRQPEDLRKRVARAYAQQVDRDHTEPFFLLRLVDRAVAPTATETDEDGHGVKGVQPRRRILVVGTAADLAALRSVAMTAYTSAAHGVRGRILSTEA